MVDKVAGIYAKIAKVQADLGNIPKNGVGPSSKGSFEYVKFDDVLLGIRDQFVQVGIVNTVKTLKHDVNVQLVNNRSVINTSILVEYTYTDVEDGSTFTTVVGGEGSDIGGDTATRKAYTQALKIALLQTFNIVTGEEPDSDGYEQAEVPTAQGGNAAAAKPESGIDAVRSKIGAIIADPNTPYTGTMVNELGRKFSGKSDDNEWPGQVSILKKVLKALEAGEVA